MPQDSTIAAWTSMILLPWISIAFIALQVFTLMLYQYILPNIILDHHFLPATSEFLNHCVTVEDCLHSWLHITLHCFAWHLQQYVFWLLPLFNHHVVWVHMSYGIKVILLRFRRMSTMPTIPYSFVHVSRMTTDNKWYLFNSTVLMEWVSNLSEWQFTGALTWHAKSSK